MTDLLWQYWQIASSYTLLHTIVIDFRTFLLYKLSIH